MALNEIQKQKRELFFNNLLLLNFDTHIMEKQYRIKFHKDMFSVANKKGFEVITHFLFAKLSEFTQEDYPVVWPLLDKEQERRFQRASFAYLTTIAQNSSIRFPTVLQSVLISYCGNRFYELYFAFSCHVVQKDILAKPVYNPEKGSALLLNRPTLAPKTSKAAFEVVQMCSHNCFEEFKNIQKEYYEAFISWQTHAKELTNLVQKLKTSYSSTQASVDEQTKLLASLFNKDVSDKNCMMEIVNEVLGYGKKVEHNWKVLEKFIIKEQEFWSKISSELDENKKPVLDGSSIKLQLPDCIFKELTESEKEIYLNEKKSEKMSIVWYVKILIILLKFFSRVIGKGDFSKIQGVSANDVNIMKDCLIDLSSLNTKLSSDVLPNSIQCVESLKEEALNTTDVSEEFMNFFEEFHFEDKVGNSECSKKQSILKVTDRILEAPQRGSIACDVSLDKSTDETVLVSQLCNDKTPYTCKSVLRSKIDNSCVDLQSVSSNLPQRISETSIFSPLSPAKFDEEIIFSSGKTVCTLNIDDQLSPLVSCGRESDVATKDNRMSESWQVEDLNLMTLPDVPLLD